MIGDATTSDAMRYFTEQEPYGWLLDKRNPSARYLTLRDLFDSDIRDPHTRQAQVDIADWPPVRRILAVMDPVDFWGRQSRPFYGGAIGTQATIGLLGQLGLPILAQVEAACENLLKYGQYQGGGFSYDGTAEHTMLCYTGTSIRALAHFGYGSDERTIGAVEYLVMRATSPEGFACPFCEAGACEWGIAKALGGFAALPPAQLTPERINAVDIMADSLLNYEFDFGDRDANWLQFGFPLYYESDLVELCDVLARLGYGSDKRFTTLMDLVMAAQTDRGRWIKAFGTRTLQVEKRGAPSKWITIHALRTMRYVTKTTTVTARSSLHGPWSE